MLIDSFENLKRMQDAGFNQEQSKALIEVWSGVVKDNFVTKNDLNKGNSGVS